MMHMVSSRWLRHRACRLAESLRRGKDRENKRQAETGIAERDRGKDSERCRKRTQRERERERERERDICTYIYIRKAGEILDAQGQQKRRVQGLG